MDLIKFYLALFLRRLHWFVLFVALGAAIGITLSRILPPVYLAQARLLVESEQIPGSLAESTVRTQATEQLQIIQQRLLTRANLLELANRLQIYAPLPGQSPRRLDPDQIVADLRARIRITVTGGPAGRGRAAQATIVTIAFPAATAQLSSAVVNEIVTQILSENVRMRTAVAGQTLDFFEQEVERLDRELAIRQERILTFQNANQDALPDSLDFRRRQQLAEQERLGQLERTVAGLIDRRDRLVALYESTGQVAAVATAPQTPEERQLQALRDELSRALVTLAPQNPRVRMIEAQIQALEATVAQQAGAAPGIDPQQAAFQLQLTDIDGQIAFARDEIARVQARIEDLTRTIEATPANSIALGALERDYANIQDQYNQAVAARARAATGETIEAMSRGQRISVIEQATPPRAPDRPNRPLIAAAGVGGGVALGLLVVILLELLNRAVRRPQDLTARLNIVPFATVPYMRTRGEARRRSAVIALAMLVVIAGLPAAIWAIDTYYQPIDMLLARGLRATGLDQLIEQLRDSLTPGGGIGTPDGSG